MDEHAVDTLHAAVYHLVKRFVERQHLPFEVIRKFRPHLIDSNKRRPTKEYASATQLGHWGQDNEWKYFLHGGGCRLIHTITREVIDWDAPNIYRFDPYWFVGWLTWFLKQNVFFRPTIDDEAVSIISAMVNEQSDRAFQEKIFDILEQLHQSGKLRQYPDRTNKYELIG